MLGDSLVLQPCRESHGATVATGYFSANRKFENFKNFEIFWNPENFGYICLTFQGIRMRISTAEIYEDMQRKLMTATYESGAKLKLDPLQKEYACSASTVRDVLLRLTRVGLVEFEEQRGFRVRRTSPQRRHDVARFRILLEQEGARQSIRKGGLDWEADLSAAHHKLSHIETRMTRGTLNPADMALWSDAEKEFHNTLISACGSEMLRETYDHVYSQFRQQMMGQERDFGTDYFQAIITEHQAILDAALARDETACNAAILKHMQRNLVA